MSNSTYTPGVCNIGPKQIKTRQLFGLFGMMFFLVTWAVLDNSLATLGWYWLLVLPAFAASLGYLQAYYHFCADFGLRGVFNVSPDVGIKDTPIQAKFREQDRQKAILILKQSFSLGIIITALVILFIRII
jgi:hypothetical protein